MIEGVVVKECVVHTDDRGVLIEIIRDDEPVFQAIKQTTFTLAYPGVIKAFHWHRRQWDYWDVVQGDARIVLTRELGVQGRLWSIPDLLRLTAKRLEHPAHRWLWLVQHFSRPRPV